MKFKKGYGQRIETIRHNAGLTKAEFARLVLEPKSSGRTVTKIEAEEIQPSAYAVDAIAALGGVDHAWIVKGKSAFKAHDILDVPGIGDRIREARTARGLTKLALSRAIKLGDTPQNIRRLEIYTHAPRRHTVERIAKALKVPFNQLAFGA